MSLLGKALGAVANVGTLGLYGQGKKLVNNATQNNFKATTYGMTSTPGKFVMGKGGMPRYEKGATTVDPNVAAAFQYNDPNQQMYTDQANQQIAAGAAARQAQQGIDTQSNANIDQLTAQATGMGPSVATEQMKAAMDANRASASSIAQGAVAQGVNPALAMQSAQGQTAMANQGAGATAAADRMQEQLNGQNALAGALQARTTQNLQQQDLTNSAAGNFLTMGQQGTQYGTQSQKELQELLSGNFNTAQQLNSGVAAGNVAAKTGLLGAGIGALGSAGAMAMKSDERAKESVDREKTGAEVDDFIKNLDTASWNYKEGVGEDSKKRRWGVMAQSLAKTDVGRSLLETGDDGYLHIDTVKGFGAVLAAQRRLADRMETLEKVRRRSAS